MNSKVREIKRAMSRRFNDVTNKAQWDFDDTTGHALTLADVGRDLCYARLALDRSNFSEAMSFLRHAQMKDRTRDYDSIIRMIESLNYGDYAQESSREPKFEGSAADSVAASMVSSIIGAGIGALFTAAILGDTNKDKK